MIYVITYADKKFQAAQKYNEHSAYRHGADGVYKFGPSDIDCEFKEKNQEILISPRGNGYWLWKPYFIDKILKRIKEGDWIVYTDSALYFNRNIHKYIEKFEKQGMNFVVQETKFLEKQFTKADVLSALECDDEQYTNSKQLAATVILLKNCVENRRLILEWLNYSQNKELISDDITKQNCEDFIENRHDQSILSLLCKKRKVSIDNNLFRDIVLPFHRSALLTYHHSIYANKCMMFGASIIRVLKVIFG